MSKERNVLLRITSFSVEAGEAAVGARGDCRIGRMSAAQRGAGPDAPALLTASSRGRRSRASVIIAAMRWVITLSGSNRDMQRLLAASLEDVSADPTEAGQLLLELHDSEGDESSDQSRRAVRADIDLRVRHINGFGKLRWGRNFEGVAIKGVRSFDSSGREAQHVYVGTAHDHMLPRDFADMVERLGHPRPPLPVGLDVIEALDGGAVTALAASNPAVARVLHLVEPMLEGDEQIDWGAGYSALEAIEHDLSARGVDGHPRGWWTNKERENFKKTANSAEALGVLARHGKPGGVAEPYMSYSRGELVRPPRHGALADASSRSRGAMPVRFAALCGR